MATNLLQKVNRRIKELRRKHPSLTFKQAQKKAWMEYRGGSKKISGVKKHSRKKKRRIHGPSSPHVERTDRKKVEISIGSAAHHISQACKRYKEQLGHLLLRRELATGRQRKKLSREISKKKQQIKRLQ